MRKLIINKVKVKGSDEKMGKMRFSRQNIIVKWEDHVWKQCI